MVWEDGDWISLVQNMDSWLAVVNAVMDLRIPYVLGISGQSEHLLTSERLTRRLDREFIHTFTVT